ncbi:tRNA (adenosine(37)-N6)-threonylcarbamoyltransferase complex ATPase subunit type 1 TsaE [Litoribaculum gwangyangense]|uniref:tRNA threonylcarbamoyladenosine biosynthesis protein TsaE n=1 Tax=Litoribaculum gwangyangense TaxID=1130722 RepID=A0ABP9CDQ7_9FLAO
MEISYKLNEIERVVDQLIKNLKTKTLLVQGSMGVGKTTLIKCLVRNLGSKDEVSSPTFSIVNEYSLNDGKIYHFDLYRINNLDEAYNLGIEDYLNSDHWKLIEWPDLIEPILNDDFDKISIEIDKEKNRILKLNS